MKIILSPSKTMDITVNDFLPKTTIIDQTKTNYIIQYLRQLSQTELQHKMRISNNLAKEVYHAIQTFEDQKEGQAIHSYTGFVFQKLDIQKYTQEDYDYLERHVVILDALYGVLKPSTMIKQYRLDFQMKLGLNLYQLWDIDAFIEDDLIINLASSEYSKLIKNVSHINILFLQNKNGTFKNIPTHTKQARGLMLDYMIKNKSQSVKELTMFEVDGYHYNKELSTPKELVFTR